MRVKRKKHKSTLPITDGMPRCVTGEQPSPGCLRILGATFERGGRLMMARGPTPQPSVDATLSNGSSA